jgi:hypothetical protein
MDARADACEGADPFGEPTNTEFPPKFNAKMATIPSKHIILASLPLMRHFV